MRASQHLWRAKNSFFALIALFVLIVGCAGPQKKAGPVSQENEVIQPTHFTSDLYVDENGKSFKLKSELYVLSASAVRIDVLTSLDLPLASIVLTQDQIRYALYRDKKVYQGAPNPQALDPVFPLAVEATDLVSMLMEKPTPNQICKRDAEGKLESCTATDPIKYSVEWGKRTQTGPSPGRVILRIPDRNAELKFYMRNIERNIPTPGALLQINVPADFKTLPVPNAGR